jgi:hypothetical protein
MYIRYEKPPRAGKAELAGVAKTLTEACCKASPDSVYNCNLKYEGDPSDHLHKFIDENGCRVAEWFDIDTAFPERCEFA